MQAITKTFEFGGQQVTLETGRIARQATGAVLVTMGEIQVLCTVVGAKDAKDGQDFFPLSVHYIEKTYSVGKIPGSHEAYLTLREGRYHQVKRMFAALGNKVVALHRDRIGEIVLDEDLLPGEYRELTADEIGLATP